ncbi:MAG: hypothetical protein H6756_08660 [Candidatus Omnitrophica bacterium]|nr:hypothetical protein [Candidatus Omnitrophota bacterium]
MGTYANITPEQLRAFSGEHLYYEIDMLYGVVERLSEQHAPQDSYLINSLLEAYVIHTQVILDFFYQPQMKADDAKAIHFIRDVRRWKQAMPPYDRYFRKFNRRRSREVVHLSYHRMDIQPEDKPWNLVRTTEHVKLVVNAFLEHADPDKLHPRMYDLKRNVEEKYRQPEDD